MNLKLIEAVKSKLSTLTRSLQSIQTSKSGDPNNQKSIENNSIIKNTDQSIKVDEEVNKMDFLLI